MASHTPSQAPLRPRHALCAHCAYHFNAAVPIIDGHATCPECGLLTPFTFDSMARRRATGARAASLTGFFLAFFAVLMLVAVLMHLLGFSHTWAARAAAWAIAFVVTILLAHAAVSLRRFLLGRPTRP